MKKIYTGLFFLLTPLLVSAQFGVYIKSGATVTGIKGSSLVIQGGHFINQGIFTGNNNSVKMTGGFSSDTIGGNGQTRFDTLEINKPGQHITLTGLINVNADFKLVNGYFNLHNSWLALGDSYGRVVGETEDHYITSDSLGIITKMANVFGPAAQLNPGNLGARITTQSALSTIFIIRGHFPQTNQLGKKSAYRYYDVSAVYNDVPIGADTLQLELHYWDHELNGAAKSDLTLWNYTGNGNIWNFYPPDTRDDVGDWLGKYGTTPRNKWTIGAACVAQNTTQNRVLCAGDTLFLGTHKYTQSDTYRDTFKAKNGCDSIIITNLKVTPKTTITSQPADIVECQGDVGSLKVTASKNVYQWQQSADGTTNWKNIADTSAIFTPPSLVSGSTYYRVIVGSGNLPCDTAISRVAKVTVSPKTAITTQPADIVECQGDVGSLKVTASKNVYQWQQSADGTTNWTNTGDTSAIFTPPSLVSGTTYYRVIAGSGNLPCDTAISRVAKVTVSPKTAITTQPADIVECQGDVGSLKVTASKNVYQWQQSADGTTNWTNLPDTSAIFTPPSLVSGTTYYRAIVGSGNLSCDTAISRVAKVTVSPKTTITTQPADIAECQGGVGSLKVTASKNVYQWQQSADGTTNWTNLPDTSAIFTPPSSVLGTAYYRVIVGSGNLPCDTAVSRAAKVTITPGTSITSQPADIAECQGGVGSLKVTASKNVYQWQQSADGTTNWKNTGDTSAIFTPPSSVLGTAYYRVIVGSGSLPCDTAISRVAKVTVSPKTTITTQPSDIAECQGGVGSLKVTASKNVYQWQQSADGTTNWKNIADTSAIFTPPSLVSGSTYYRVIVGSGNLPCDTAISRVAKVTVSPKTAITTQPADIVECQGDFGSLKVTASKNVYQWQQSADGTTNWTNLPDTSAIFTPPSLVSGTTYYRVIVGSGNLPCDTAISRVAKVTVSPKTAITTQPADIAECQGGVGSLKVTASKNVYQWQQSADGTTNWTNLPDTSAIFTPPSSVLGTAYYRVIVGSGSLPCDTAVSRAAKVTIMPGTSITSQPADIAECQGGVGSLKVTASKNVYQWQQSADGATGWANINDTTAIFTPPATTLGAMFYRVIIGVGETACDTAISRTAKVTISASILDSVETTICEGDSIIVNGHVHNMSGVYKDTFQREGACDSVVVTSLDVIPALKITTQPESFTECTQGTSTLVVEATSGVFQWQQTKDTTRAWTNITNATESTFTPPSNVESITYYRVVVTSLDSSCPRVISNIAKATIGKAQIILQQPDSVAQCMGSNKSLKISAPDATFQWQQSANGAGNWANASTGTGATDSVYTPPNQSPVLLFYRAIATPRSSACGGDTSRAVKFQVFAPVNINTQPAALLEECSGQVKTATIVASGGTVQWQQTKDTAGVWTDVANATASVFTPPSALAGVTFYRAVVSPPDSVCPKAVSTVARVSVTKGITIVKQPDSIIQCKGANRSLQVSAPGASFQWQQSPKGDTGWVNVTTGTGATDSIFTPSSSTAGVLFFRAIATSTNSDCGGSETSRAVRFEVVASVQIDTQPQILVNECVGEGKTLTVSASGGIFQWRQKTENGGWINATAGGGATTPNYTPPSSATGSIFYRVLVSSPNNACGGPKTSDSSKVTVAEKPAISRQPSDISECAGVDLALTVTAVGVVFQWQQSVDSTNWSPATGTGAQTASFIPPNDSVSVKYYRVIVGSPGGFCGQSTSKAVKVQVTGSKNMHTIDTTLCTGASLLVGDTLFNEKKPSGTVHIKSKVGGCDSIISVKLTFKTRVVPKDSSITLKEGATELEIDLTPTEAETGGKPWNIYIITKPVGGKLDSLSAGKYKFTLDATQSCDSIRFAYLFCGGLCGNCDSVKAAISANVMSERITAAIVSNDMNRSGLCFPLLANCPAYMEESELRVFSRWGETVYTGSSKQADCWKGINNDGKELPAGTYYFNLKSKASSMTIRGSVTIIRDK